jgi:hypothetical protein
MDSTSTTRGGKRNFEKSTAVIPAQPLKAPSPMAVGVALVGAKTP